MTTPIIRYRVNKIKNQTSLLHITQNNNVCRLWFNMTAKYLQKTSNKKLESQLIFYKDNT